MVPKEFREHLVARGQRYIRVTKGMGEMRRLEVWTDAWFQDYRDRLNAQPETALIRKARKFYLQNAVRVELDANGRLVIPARLRLWAGIAERVAFVGVDETRFELWSPEAFDNDDDDFAENWETNRDILAGVGL